MSGLGLGLESTIVNADARIASVERLRESGALLPTWDELANPTSIPTAVTSALSTIDPDEPHPLNLWRVHWYNAANRRDRAPVPEHIVLPPELTGVDTPIIVLYGNRFPMISAHKVLAAYGCLVPRLVSGQFDAAKQRAVWPSTGNYCRGGIAISKVLGCRGVAVLPEGMSEERFAWLRDWSQDPGDIISTYGTESNVKEIYDKCAELAGDPLNTIFNQFCEFGNHLIHYHCTGQAANTVFDSVRKDRPGLKLAAFVSATGSAGTIAAGDYLKDEHGSQTVAVEALECPTMLYNGFGEHNIQGIGDKHIPYIHNVMNTDVVTAVSDAATDSLFFVFGSDDGKEALEKRGLSSADIAALSNFGFSGICNMLAAIKTAKTCRLGRNDAIVTIATDGANLYESEREKIRRKRFPSGFDRQVAASMIEQHLDSQSSDDTLVLEHRDRERIFNLGYFTWVEQQGVDIADFEKRRSQEFWRGLRELIPAWNQMISDFNSETGVDLA